MPEAPVPSDEVLRPRWYVMRAYKSESKAEEVLSGEDGLEHFIAKRYAVRVYHGVKSRRLVPAIPGLVFVHASRQAIAAFKRRWNFLQFVVWRQISGRQEYLSIDDEQMASFMKLASAHGEHTVYLRPEEVDLSKGTRVCIHGGQFDGARGVFMRVQGKRNRRIVVMLEGVLGIAAEVHPDLVEVLP